MPLLAIHPGEHLAEELKELNMSAAALARQLQVPTTDQGFGPRVSRPGFSLTPNP